MATILDSWVESSCDILHVGDFWDLFPFFLLLLYYIDIYSDVGNFWHLSPFLIESMLYIRIREQQWNNGTTGIKKGNKIMDNGNKEGNNNGTMEIKLWIMEINEWHIQWQNSPH